MVLGFVYFLILYACEICCLIWGLTCVAFDLGIWFVFLCFIAPLVCCLFVAACLLDVWIRVLDSLGLIIVISLGTLFITIGLWDSNLLMGCYNMGFDVFDCFVCFWRLNFRFVLVACFGLRVLRWFNWYCFTFFCVGRLLWVFTSLRIDLVWLNDYVFLLFVLEYLCVCVEFACLRICFCGW